MRTNGSRGQALVITPSFFGYQNDIVAELRRKGFATYLVDERPSNGSLERAICRVRKSLIGSRIERYYLRQLKVLADLQLSFVIVIKAEVVPRWFLLELRQRHPGAKFIFYTFDALRNANNCFEVLDCFDERLTFDWNDSQRGDFGYLPLFYSPHFSPVAATTLPRKYLCAFVGTLHTERYKFVNRLFVPGTPCYKFFYVQARWYFFVMKYLTREHRGVAWNEVSFESMDRSDVAEVFRNSLAVLDMQRAGQDGLTMRTFEVLASGSVLVTTNAGIVREPFYDATRVIIVPEKLDEADLDAVRSIIEGMSPPDGAPDSFEKYSLESWTNSLLHESVGLP